MTAIVRCGDPACPCNRVLFRHESEPGCVCGCGLAHCVTCGEVWPCTTEAHRRREDPRAT